MQDEMVLVQRARQNPREFTALYDRYVDRIYAYAQRETGDVGLAQDIVSATFEKALRNVSRYEWRGTSFGAWLYKIARNELLMHYRRRKWTIPLWDSLLSPLRVEQVVQTHEVFDEVSAAMLKLPARDQELLRLRYYEDLSHAEIGEILNKSSGTVAVALHRALKRLRKQLSQHQSEVIYDVSIQ